MEQNSKKKKKKGKKKIVTGVVCFCLLTAAGGILFWQKQEADASESVIEITAGQQEEIIYAQIDSIVGNDLELSLAEKETVSAGGDGKGMPAPEEEESAESSVQDIGSTGGQRGGMDSSAYTLTGETKSLEVPVGTEVITKLGVVTTFSRLSSGNFIAVLLEEGTDNILKIWIVS